MTEKTKRFLGALVAGPLLLLLAWGTLALFDEGGDKDNSKTSTFRSVQPGSPGYVPPNSINFSPARIVQNVEADGPDLPPLQLTNTTKQVFRVQLGFYPYTRTTPEGSPRFTVDEESLRKGKDLVRLQSYEVQLGPGQVKTIQAKVVGRPEGDSPEAFGVIVADVRLPKSTAYLPADVGGNRRSISLDPILRLLGNAWIKYEETGSSSLALQRPVLEQNSGGLLAKIEVKAKGNTSAEPGGEFLLYQDGKVLQRVYFSSGELIPPGQSADVVAERLFDPLAPGAYTVVAEANSGGVTRRSKRSFRINDIGLVVGSGQKLPPYGLRLTTEIAKYREADVPTPMRISLTNTGRKSLRPKVVVSIDNKNDLRGPIRDTFRVKRLGKGEDLALSTVLESLPGGSYIVETEVFGPGNISLARESQDLNLAHTPVAPRPDESSGWPVEDPLLLVLIGLLMAGLFSLALIGAISLLLRAFKRKP